MKTKNKDIIKDNKIFIWIAIVTGLILSIPLIAMQFSTDVDWKLNDFVIMGTLIFGTGFLFVHVARIVPIKYRFLVAIIFLVALVLTWVELAVGLFGTPFQGS